MFYEKQGFYLDSLNNRFFIPLSVKYTLSNYNVLSKWNHVKIKKYVLFKKNVEDCEFLGKYRKLK